LLYWLIAAIIDIADTLLIFDADIFAIVSFFFRPC